MLPPFLVLMSNAPTCVEDIVHKGLGQWSIPHDEIVGICCHWAHGGFQGIDLLDDFDHIGGGTFGRQSAVPVLLPCEFFKGALMRCFSQEIYLEIFAI